MEQPPLDPQRARAAILANLANGKRQRRESLLRLVADQGLLLSADALDPRTPSDYGPLNLVLGGPHIRRPSPACRRPLRASKGEYPGEA